MYSNAQFYNLSNKFNNKNLSDNFNPPTNSTDKNKFSSMILNRAVNLSVSLTCGLVLFTKFLLVKTSLKCPMVTEKQTVMREMQKIYFYVSLVENVVKLVQE